MPHVTINGEPAEVSPTETLADAVSRLTALSEGIAVAVNREIVPRSTWTRTTLAEGDRIEVVTAAPGG